MAPFLERARWVPYAAMAAFGGLLAWQSLVGTFDALDGPAAVWLSERFRLPGAALRVVTPNPPPARRSGENAAVTLIEIGNASREQTWPLQPLDYAAIFRALQASKPAVLAVEEVLWWPDGTPFTDVLERYLLPFPQVLLAWELGTPQDPGFAFEGRPVLRRVKGSVAQVPECKGAQLAPSENLALLAAQGFAGLHAARGTSVHRIPLLMRAGRDLLPAATLRAAMQWWHLPPEEVEVEIGRHVVCGRYRTVPIDHRGMMRLTPTALSLLQRFETGELLLAAERRETSRHPQIPLGALENRVVFVGRTDTEARIYRDPLGKPVSRVELLAAALAVIQGDWHVQRAPVAVHGVFVSLAVWLLWWARRGRRRRAPMGAAVALSALAFAGAYAYAAHSVSMPTTMGILLASAIVLYRMLLPGRIQRGHGTRPLLKQRARKRRRSKSSPVSNPKASHPGRDTASTGGLPHTPVREDTKDED